MDMIIHPCPNQEAGLVKEVPGDTSGQGIMKYVIEKDFAI